jgi:hypothetical protein
MSRRWEYRVISTTATGVPFAGEPADAWHDRVAKGLTEQLGAEGWELCGVLSQMMFFKREISEQVRYDRLVELLRDFRPLADGRGVVSQEIRKLIGQE